MSGPPGLTKDLKMRKEMKIPSATKLGMRMTPKRLGWDVGKALQLRLVKHLTYKQIASLLKVSEGAIRTGLLPLMSLLQDPEAVTAFRENEAELMDSIRMLAMQAMGEQLTNEKRRKKLDLLRLNNLYGTLFDKQRLVRGESTAIVHQLTAIISAAHKDKGKSKDDPLDITPDGDEDTQAEG